MSTAPTRPAAMIVFCAPSAPATGPVRANETGTRPVETSQSRLEIRPSRSRGTTVWRSVIQMIWPISNSARSRGR